MTCGLAPALGAVGLAGVFPTVAGQAASWRARAAMGAVGYWWLVPGGAAVGPTAVAGSSDRRDRLGGLAERGLQRRAGAPAEHSVCSWARRCGRLRRCCCRWLVRGRSAPLDLVAATIWTAALLAAAPLLDHGLPLVSGQPSPRGALAAAILGGALAVGARALRGPV